jgi:hypothetical protein
MYQKSKVFISSTQYQDEFKIERSLLPFLFNKDPLAALFDIWEIEEQAAPISIQSQYLSNIDTSNIFIILIDSAIRQAVVEEYERAKKDKLPVYCFIRENVLRSNEANMFIDKIRNDNNSTCNYSDFKDLALKVEGSLLGYYHTLIVGNNKSELGKAKYDIEERTLRIALGLLNRKSIGLSKVRIMRVLIAEKLRGSELTREEIGNALREYDKEQISSAF